MEEVSDCLGNVELVLKHERSYTCEEKFRILARAIIELLEAEQERQRADLQTNM